MDVPSSPASLIIFAGEPGDRRNGRQPPDAAHTPRPVMTRLPTANLIITFLFYYASAIARHQTPPFSFRFILVTLPPLPPPFFAPAHPHFAPTAAAVRFVSRRRPFFSPRREREGRLERDRKLITANIDYRRRAYAGRNDVRARFLGRGLTKYVLETRDPRLRFMFKFLRPMNLFTSVETHSYSF